MELKTTLPNDDLQNVTFTALPVGGRIGLVASADQDTYFRLCALGAANDDLPNVIFTALPVGDKVVLVARVDQETFDRLCAAGAEFEDLEPDADVEAEETVDGWSG